MKAMSILRQLQRYLGLTGTLGAGLLIASVLAYFFAVMPAQHHAMALVQQLSQTQSSPPVDVNARPEGDSAKLSVFYKRFDDISSLPLWLESLHKLAAELKLEQIEGEYKLTADDDGKIVRYEIQLPVKGSYPDVRHFMDEAAKRIPNLGLRDIDLRRKAVEDGTVEARMTFILFLLEH